MSQRVLLVIDTDSGFQERFQRKLEAEDIADAYKIHWLKPNTTLERSEMAKRVVADARQVVAAEAVCAIFVDIVIYERAEFDTDGILIADRLRDELTQIPIFSVSGKANETKVTHLDHFAEASLGNCDGVFPKSFLEGDTFSTKRLKLILRRGEEKRAEHRVSGGSHIEANEPAPSSLPAGISDSFDTSGMDGRVLGQIEELGPGTTWSLIQRLLPYAKGTLSYVSPGASGAFVFEANVKFEEPGISPTRAKKLLVKISRDTKSLQKEASNRKNLIKAPASRKHFPSLLQEAPVSFDGLSAIAYEFETHHVTLLDFLARDFRGEHAGKGIAKKLVSVLAEIYGDPRMEVKYVWAQCYQLPDPTWTKLRGYLLENGSIIESIVGAEALSRVDNFLINHGDRLRTASVEIDTRFIHGDLNCGNVLIDGTNRSELGISIIDFGSRRQDHIIKDVAKLERDIVFRIFDWGSMSYHDPDRRSTWQPVLDTLATPAIFTAPLKRAEEDEAITAAKYLIYELRSELKSIDRVADERNYQMALLHYALLALLHPKISTAKKAFAIEYLSTLIVQLGC